jgi:hypothetical protein
MRGVMHLAEGAADDFGAAAHDAGGDVVLQIGSRSACAPKSTRTRILVDLGILFG